MKLVQYEPNVSGFPKEAIIIETNGATEIEKFKELDPERITPEEIRIRIKEAGIVGQGGAAFPTFIKLTPAQDKNIDYVILNGCECEPYLTRDYRLMIEKPYEVLSGLNLILKSLKASKGVIGIEDNKPEAIAKLKPVSKDFPE
jgi:electron transport complex protein RnfC